VQERVDYRNTLTSAELALQLVSPPLLGIRIGAGLSRGYHWTEVSRRGRTTGRIHEPFKDAEDPMWGSGRLLTVERNGFVLDQVRLEAALARFRLNFGHCVMDSWALCGRHQFTRYTVGIAYGLR
jgi:hypothetical protein